MNMQLTTIRMVVEQQFNYLYSVKCVRQYYLIPLLLELATTASLRSLRSFRSLRSRPPPPPPPLLEFLITAFVAVIAVAATVVDRDPSLRTVLLHKAYW